MRELVIRSINVCFRYYDDLEVSKGERRRRGQGRLAEHQLRATSLPQFADVHVLAHFGGPDIGTEELELIVNQHPARNLWWQRRGHL